MTRSYRFPFIECFAVLGMLLGAWLVQQAFQPGSDLPNRALIAIGGLDILLCFGALGYQLRANLRAGQPLGRLWIITASVLLAGFLGWTTALMIDAERLRSQEAHQSEYDQQLVKLENSLHNFSEVIPATTFVLDRTAWQASHDRYTMLHGQLQTAVRGNAQWEKDLARIDEQVQGMQKLLPFLTPETAFEVRFRSRLEFHQAREKADQLTDTLRNEIAQSTRDLGVTHRIRWQSVGASALTSAFLIIGCMLMWFVFDRELRRSWKRAGRLAVDEARFRGLVESQADPIAMLDAAGVIAYINPAWSAFNYTPDEVLGRRLIDLIHADDRPRVYAVTGTTPVNCRLSADYGVWHDVELRLERAAEFSVARFRDLRETADVPVPQQPTPDPVEKQKLAELEAECQRLRESEEGLRRELQQERALLRASEEALRRELEKERALLQSHQRTSSEKHQELEADLRQRSDAHAQDKQTHEATLQERDKRIKHLEKQLRERHEVHADLEATLREHQDRLHKMHQTREDHAASLKTSKEAARRLASGVANELNTVLSVVLGNTDVLKENLPKDHMAQNYVEEIHNAATRGTELSQRLLAFSRNHLLQTMPFEVNDHLTSLVPKLRAALGHDVKLDWHAGAEDLWIKSDPHPLEQAVLMIATHARQHMPDGGTLTVRAKHVEMTKNDITHADMAPGVYVQLSLEDNGAGIENDKLPHLFEPYHPIADGHKGDLSLATAYGIIRQSGGTIEVASEPGAGTEWSILLPVTDERPALRASA